jgi:putative membrane protein
MIRKVIHHLRYNNAENEKMILRDHLALERTRLANERTFLAYLKTAIVLLASGLALMELKNFEAYRQLGIWIVLASPVLLLTGFVRMIIFRIRIKKYYE